MAKDLFSVPIFFIVFRETLEAAIIVSVLLSLVEQIVRGHDDASLSPSVSSPSSEATKVESQDPLALEVNSVQKQNQLLKKLRVQVFAGAAVGLLVALSIGAAFIAVYFTTLQDLWSKSEDLWEGIFSLIACLMIWVMSLAMLKMDRAKAQWKYKLRAAFEKRQVTINSQLAAGGRSGKYALFILPLVTVLREGLEAVVFIGGVALGEPGSSIPIAAITGLACGAIIGFIIYFSSRRINISIFLIISTSFLLLIGAGLFSKAVGYFQFYKFNQGVGSDVEELGNGPGSYDVRGNVWHLTWGNPESNTSGEGWSIFNAIFGWTNTASQGTILSYVFYWLSVIVALVYMKWSEGRMTFFGRESAMGKDRRLRRETRSAAARLNEKAPDSPAASEEDEPMVVPHL